MRSQSCRLLMHLLQALGVQQEKAYLDEQVNLIGRTLANDLVKPTAHGAERMVAVAFPHVSGHLDRFGSTDFPVHGLSLPP